MELKFNDIQKELLEFDWKEKSLLTIKGVNGFGEPFETVGRITTNDKGKSGIEDTMVYIEFGVTKDKPTDKQTSYFAPYALNASTDQICDGAQFIIKSIQKQNGFILYENKDFAKIEEICKNNLNKFLEKNTFTNNEDPVTRALKQMIGKPIRLNGTSAVLASVEGNTTQGNTILNLCSGPLVGCEFVNNNSILYTENNDGGVVVLASNRHNYNYFDKKNEDTENE